MSHLNSLFRLIRGRPPSTLGERVVGNGKRGATRGRGDDTAVILVGSATDLAGMTRFVKTPWRSNHPPRSAATTTKPARRAENPSSRKGAEQRLVVISGLLHVLS